MRLDTVSLKKSLKGPEKNQGSQVVVTGRQADVLSSGDHVIWLPSTKEGWEGGLPEELGTSGGNTCRELPGGH